MNKKRETILVYIPKEDKFLSVTYGSGDNLTREDIENGYDSYLVISIHEFDEEYNVFKNDVDGGELLYKSSEKAYDYNILAAAEAAVDFMFDKKQEWIPLIPEIAMDSEIDNNNNMGLILDDYGMIKDGSGKIVMHRRKK